jgi:beta-fructofuranosidase
VRPAAHFTPRHGWINDPYGVRWDGRRYHMCYQALPDRTAWSPECTWGHAVSTDLVAWEERGQVLGPGPDGLGCWSGSVVGDRRSEIRAFYTRVTTGNLDLGQIAVARWDGSGRLTSSADDVVIAAPPVGVAAFRDPYAWRDELGWTMIVGAGTSDGAGAVLQYRSADLNQWQYTGVVCRGRVPGVRGTASQVWECPQLMRVGDRWLLVVSVQVGGSAGHVAALAGSYDRVRLIGGEWRQLAFGTAPYATSLFRDRRGHPCMISWLREDPRFAAEPAPWAGAHSLVSSLAIDRGGRVTASPHPATCRGTAFTHVACATCDCVIRVIPGVAEHVRVACDGPLELEVRRAGRWVARVSRRRGRTGLIVERPGCAADLIPSDEREAIEAFVDADILEVFAGGTYGAWRLPPGHG